MASDPRRDVAAAGDGSPSDYRQIAGYEPITGWDDEHLSESFETVRRRPEVTGNSGVPTSSTTASKSTATQESIGAHDCAHPPGLVGGGTRSTANSKSQVLPRKPHMARRASSHAQAPHRGEVFSVDDDIDEIEAEILAQRQERPQPHTTTVRRRNPAPPNLTKLHSHARDDGEEQDRPGTSSGVRQEHVEEQDDSEPADEEEDSEELSHEGDEGDISDAESFTLKDRQQAINETHPFGIRLWKPALYKKDRSVQKISEGDIHSSPGGHVSRWLLFFNITWTLGFGWWMALIAFIGSGVCFLFAATRSGREYGSVLWGLGGYMFYPFGKFVRLEQQEAYLDEDEGEGRSISEYEQWQSGDLEYGRLFFGPDRNRSIVGRSRRSLDSDDGSETDSLLGRGGRERDSDSDLPRPKRRLFGRGKWNMGRVIFFLFFYFLLMPSLFMVSAMCWFMVFWIPMGKVTMLLFYHLRRHPLALSFESDISAVRSPAAPNSSILVCTYRAVGLKYWKYTIDGTNVFLINLMAIVGFVILDWLVLKEMLHLDMFITSSAFLFVGGLFSIIPLAYFIGQAVASISAQSSMGLGAAINAFFSTIVEVFLYCVALQQGKAQLVEGSIIGSIFAGILFLPGLSMCFGAIKRKTQRFNSKSAGVTSTMLLFAVIGAFGPTLFYQIYGTHELRCNDCVDEGYSKHGHARDCRRCYFSQAPAINDRFYIEAVRPYCYLAASLLFFSYVIGLWFTLRTHAAVIWNIEMEEKKQEDQQREIAAQVAQNAALASFGESTATDIRDSHLYKRILRQSLRQVGLQPQPGEERHQSVSSANTPLTSHHKSMDYGATASAHVHMSFPSLTDAENEALAHQVAQIAATAAAVAARDRFASTAGRRVPATSGQATSSTAAQQSFSSVRPQLTRMATCAGHDDTAEISVGHGGGHDAPNWSRFKSSIILCGATALYAIIAEILVNTVDVVLENYKIDEKFLGITLFALVPNTTEFLNAISFAMNGNIALSMEIGSAYALQVCLLQIPALVLFSALYPLNPPENNFSLLFPQWDMVTVILCVFLLSYMYGEGKSNYFKGSILLLSYFVVVAGYFFSDYATGPTNSQLGMSRFDIKREDGGWISHEDGPFAQGFKTVGRTMAGVAF